MRFLGYECVMMLSYNDSQLRRKFSQWGELNPAIKRGNVQQKWISEKEIERIKEFVWIIEFIQSDARFYYYKVARPSYKL